MRKMLYGLSVLVFLMGLLVTAPAKLLPYAARKASVDLSAMSVTGSLWRGNAEGLRFVAGKTIVYVTSANWEIDPFSLLMGKVCVQLNLNLQNMPLAGEVCGGLGGNLTLSHFTAQSQVGPLLDMLGFPFPIDGAVDLQVDRAVWQPEAGFANVDGVAKVQNYAYRVANETLVLGDYRMTLGAEEGLLALHFEPGDALIALQGKIVIDPMGSYHAQLNFIPSNRATPALVNSLQFVAARQADNTFVLNYKGKF